jgi:hypothetical protein
MIVAVFRKPASTPSESKACQDLALLAASVPLSTPKITLSAEGVTDQLGYVPGHACIRFTTREKGATRLAGKQLDRQELYGYSCKSGGHARLPARGRNHET